MHLLFSTDGAVDVYRVNALREAGHVVEVTDRLDDGLAMTADGDYQAAVLDLRRPSATCVTRFAKVCSATLLLVLTDESRAGEHSALLRAGADACFDRLVPSIELEARLEALARLLKRAQRQGAPPIEMVAAQQSMRVKGQTTALSAREFRVMEHMLAHAGEVISLDRLHQYVWGDEADPRPDMVRKLLSRVRRKLEAAGGAGVLRNVVGHGYVLDAGKPPSEAPLS